MAYKRQDVTLPVRVTRFSISTSSPFMAGTGNAKVKMTDARTARIKRAKRDMVFRFWGLDRVAQWKDCKANR